MLRRQLCRYSIIDVPSEMEHSEVMGDESEAYVDEGCTVSQVLGCGASERGNGLSIRIFWKERETSATAASISLR